MKTNAPTMGSWLIGLACLVISLLINFGILPAKLGPYKYWISIIGLGLLVLATIFRKL
jgi:hypothetical protein